MATVIPVKVLNQNGSGWSSVVARGITYVADLKAGPLADHPVVINMSLGGPIRSIQWRQAAIDYAIDQGVIIVASPGNEGEAGMGYPGAYAPVISVAASGWIGEWTAACLVADPRTSLIRRVAGDFYITDFSSRELAGQDLDVAAPGSWVVGPYQAEQRPDSRYYFLGGTSMASPHVAGHRGPDGAEEPSPEAAAGGSDSSKIAAIPLPPVAVTVDRSDPDLSSIAGDRRVWRLPRRRSLAARP